MLLPRMEIEPCLNTCCEEATSGLYAEKLVVSELLSSCDVQAIELEEVRTIPEQRMEELDTSDCIGKLLTLLMSKDRSA